MEVIFKLMEVIKNIISLFLHSIRLIQENMEVRLGTFISKKPQRPIKGS
tara:strand:+ start:262 stop:408 length:147 start_codon:yes stop_codon:yes gene_type:complete